MTSESMLNLTFTGDTLRWIGSAARNESDR